MLNPPQKKEGGRGRSSGELDLPEDCSEQRRAALLLWLRYKAERRQSYKPSGLLALVQRLKAFTDAQVTEAVSQAMANSWAGLFPEKVHPQDGQKKEGGAGGVNSVGPPGWEGAAVERGVPIQFGWEFLQQHEQDLVLRDLDQGVKP